MELLIKHSQILRAEEIDESVSNIAVILNYNFTYVEVKGQIEKVIPISMFLINFIGEQLETVLIGNILNHDGRPAIPLNSLIRNLKYPLGIDLLRPHPVVLLIRNLLIGSLLIL
jgi:hypothetical protein